MKSDIIIAVMAAMSMGAGLWAILTGQFAQTWVVWVAVLFVFCVDVLFCVAIGDMVWLLSNRKR